MSHCLAPQQLPGHGVPHLHSTVSVAIDRYLAITHLQARGQQAAGHDVADGLGLALVTASHNTLESGADHTM